MDLRQSASRVTKVEIDKLVADAEPEGQILEYKETLPGRGDDKSEFLKAIAGFANSTGGWLVLGVQEDRDQEGRSTGVPCGVPGLGGVNVDATCLQISNSIRDGITPRLVPHPEVSCVKGTEDSPVVVIRVPRSLQRPHMVRGRFYARQGAQTVQLRVEQVRNEFLEGEGISRKIREFRADRLAEVIGGERARMLLRPANMVVHVCPLEAFDGARVVDVAAVHGQSIAPPDFQGGGLTPRLNFDGACAFVGKPGESESYLQVFRNGCIEFVTSSMVSTHPERDFPSFHLTQAAKLLVIQLPQTLEKLGAEVLSYPLVIAVTFLGIKGAKACFDGYGQRWTHAVQEHQVILPEVLLGNKPEDWGSELRGTLDTMWQGVGLNSCNLYVEGHFQIPPDNFL